MTSVANPSVNDVTSQQRAAADPNMSVWVQANAGTGKTKVLIDRLARLLLSGAEPDRILGLTFTKAAAAEMQDRLFKRFRKWCALGEVELKKDLADLLGVNPSEITPEHMTKARTLLGEVLETAGGLRIETIHAFAQKLLARFPIEAQLPPNTQLVEGKEEAQLWDQAVDSCLVALNQDDPALLDAVFAVSHPDYISDAIKSTRMHLEDVLTEYNNDPAQAVIALKQIIQPPDETVASMVEQALFGARMPHETISRILKFIESLKETLTPRSNLMQFYNILSETMAADDPIKRWDAYKGLAGRKVGTFTKNYDGDADLELFRTKGEPIGAEILRLKNLAELIIQRQIFDRTEAIYHFSSHVFEAYAQEKRSVGALDNSDLIDKTLDLFRRLDSADWILYKLDSKLDHILLDEAQDTSPRQWALLDTLLKELHANPTSSGRTRTQFTVGDEKQSIYGFQGADPEGYQIQNERFDADNYPDRRIQNFGTSFRSAQNILDFVDKILDLRAPALGDDLAEGERAPMFANKTPHIAHRDLAKGGVELWPPLEDTPKAEKGSFDAWSPAQNIDHHATIEGRLAGRVADKIQSMLSSGAAIEDKEFKRLRPCEPKDFLILVEQRKPLMSVIVHALKRRGIPVAGADRLSLQDDIGVQDCLNLMRFCLQPADDLVLAEILRGPFVGLTDDDVYLTPLAYGRDGSLWEALQSAELPEFVAARQFIDACIAQRHLSPFDFLFWLLHNMGGWGKLIARLGLPSQDPINALLERALSFEADNPASLQGFLLAQAQDTSDVKRVAASDVNYVRIMTVHGAKGLEAPIVLMPQPPKNYGPRPGSLNPYKGFPIWVKREDERLSMVCETAISTRKEAELNERFRLFYVAMTRARDYLYIFEGKKRSKDDPKEESWVGYARKAMQELGAKKDEAGICYYGDTPQTLILNASQTAGDDLDDAASEIPSWVMRRAASDATGAETLESLSPSKKSDATDLIIPFSTVSDRQPAAARGTLVHALFEYLIPQTSADRALVGQAIIENQSEVAPEIAETALAQVLSILDTPHLAYLFDPQTGQDEVPVFGTIAQKDRQIKINGRIDRLIALPDRFIVLDYKSDASPPIDPQQAPAEYVVQLARYKQILEASGIEKPIEAAILWTQTGRLMTLSDESMQDALAVTA